MLLSRLQLYILPGPVASILGKAGVTVSTRRPRLRAVRPAGVEPGLRVRIAWNGTRAPNGDGIEGGGAVDYDNPLTDYLPWWPAGQPHYYGGGWLDGGWLEDGATPAMGQGWLDGPWLDGPWLERTGTFEWTVPFDLRDGSYTFGIRLFDEAGNEAESPIQEIAIIVAALPRPPALGRFVSYAANALALAWDSSPDVAA